MRRVCGGLVVGLALILAGSVSAQILPAQPTAEATAATEPTSPGEVTARRDAVATEIEERQAALDAAAPESPERAALEDEVRLLQGIENLLRRQSELIEDSSAAVEVGSEQAPDGAQPTSIFRLGELLERKTSRQSARSALQESIEANRTALATAKEKLEQSNQKRRAAKQQLETSEGSERATATAAATLRRRELETRKATEQVHLRTLEARAAQNEIKSIDAGDSTVDEEISELSRAMGRGAGDSTAGFSELSRRESDLRREREAVERDLATADLRLEAAQRRFSRQDKPSPELVEELELLTSKRDLKRREITVIDGKLERLSIARSLWEQWEKVLQGAGTREEVRAWQEAAEQAAVQLQQYELEKQGRIKELQQRIERLGARLGTESLGSVNELLDDQRALLSQWRDRQSIDAQQLAAERRLAQNVVAAIRKRTGIIDPVEYFQLGLAAARDVWRYEITDVDDSPITVASIVIALILVITGMLLSRRMSRLVGRLAIERFGVELGAAAALQTLAFYTLLASFTLLALRTVNFPLTAFTFLGGALAIGLGFGSQNLMNNFISGLILMLERPVRAQDVVEVDGEPGTIEHIGARSTQIRSTDGRHVIVPNSFFLENSVVNWTLSDDLIRTTVSVGVIYGSPTRLVEKLIRQAVDEEDKVLRHPAPVIIFEAFGDNSLNFDVYFWVHARTPMQIRTVQSRLRFRIDDLFRENDLVIAFPQRDVHLDAAQPIDIRVLRGGDASKPPEE